MGRGRISRFRINKAHPTCPPTSPPPPTHVHGVGHNASNRRPAPPKGQQHQVVEYTAAPPCALFTWRGVLLKLTTRRRHSASSGCLMPLGGVQSREGGQLCNALKKSCAACHANGCGGRAEGVKGGLATGGARWVMAHALVFYVII